MRLVFYLYAIELKDVVDEILEGAPNAPLGIFPPDLQEQGPFLPILHLDILGAVQMILKKAGAKV